MNIQEILWILFITSSGILVFFYLLLIIVFSSYKNLSAQKSNKKNGVSVIICANNELKNLQSNLKFFLDQDYPDFEIIVIDDRSSDGTYDYLFNLKGKEKSLRMMHIDETPNHINNKKYAITLGIKAAKHDVILLSDADCRPVGDQWIKGMTAPFANKPTQLVLGYSQYFKKKGALNALIRYDTLWTGLQYLGFALLGKPYMGVGRNLAYRKSLFLDSNGFGRYQHVTGGDDDLFVKEHAKRNNTSVVLSPETIIYSEPKTTWKAFSLQKKRHIFVGKLYNAGDKISLGLIFVAKILTIASFIPVILSGIYPFFSVLILLVTYSMLLAAILLFKKRSGDEHAIWQSPLLDIMHIFYYLTTGVKVLFAKRVRWK